MERNKVPDKNKDCAPTSKIIGSSSSPSDMDNSRSEMSFYPLTQNYPGKNISCGSPAQGISGKSKGKLQTNR